MRVWFSGRTRPCQGRDSGSIPGTRTNTKESNDSQKNVFNNKKPPNLLGGFFV